VAVARALRRLLRVLKLEEEQAKGALETALGELRRLEEAKLVARERERSGRELVAASARSGELADRLAGIEEARAARHAAGSLKDRMAAAERQATLRREVYLAKRVERRQAETLIQEAEAHEAREADRRSQQSADEWFLNRERGARAGELVVHACEEDSRAGETRKT
jgi:hypothetical protein